MVGHFLHPNRKNRSISANNANGSINSNPSSTSTSASTSSTSMTQPHHQQQHQFQQPYPPSSLSGISTTNFTPGGGSTINNMNLHPTYGGNPQQHQQSGTIIPPSRYAGVTPPVGAAGTLSSYDIPPTMQFQPPQNLTAEAVAALPPPGMQIVLI